jgi:hypothetical protein
MNEDVKSTITKIKRDIASAKRKLKRKAFNKGIYENFGQNEFRNLQDKYFDHLYDIEYREGVDLIFSFFDWCVNYNGDD